MKKKGLLAPSTATVFLAVDISNLKSAVVVQVDIPATPTMVELRLQNGRSLRLDGAMDAGILARLIQVVETA